MPGDIDGVVVIPKTHAAAIVADAIAKVQLRGLIGCGRSIRSIFDESGVIYPAQKWTARP